MDFLRVDLTQNLFTGPDNVDVAILLLPFPNITDNYDIDGIPIYYFATHDQIEALSFGDELATFLHRRHLVGGTLHS